jgi:glutamine amidotransferase
MCRLFAIRSRQPVSAYESLVSAPHSLQRQSCGDARKECHQDGWGIGYYIGGDAERVRSPRSALGDSAFQTLAETIRARTLLAHVRQASMGTVAESNCHPFLYGRWMFAHNGTIAGFPAVHERLNASLPDHLRPRIAGDTDSEHAFYLILARLEKNGEDLQRPISPKVLCQVMSDTIRWLADMCPGTGEEPSRFNFVLTDGQVLVASRWGHTLSCCKSSEGVMIASEPTTGVGWSEVPDRVLFWIDKDLNYEVSA